MNSKYTVYVLYMHCLYIKKILKMGPTVLFTHLKIILLQCFQFSVSATISSIQTDPICTNFCHFPFNCKICTNFSIFLKEIGKKIALKPIPTQQVLNRMGSKIMIYTNIT